MMAFVMYLQLRRYANTVMYRWCPYQHKASKLAEIPQAGTESANMLWISFAGHAVACNTGALLSRVHAATQIQNSSTVCYISNVSQLHLGLAFWQGTNVRRTHNLSCWLPDMISIFLSCAACYWLCLLPQEAGGAELVEFSKLLSKLLRQVLLLH